MLAQGACGNGLLADSSCRVLGSRPKKSHRGFISSNIINTIFFLKYHQHHILPQMSPNHFKSPFPSSNLHLTIDPRLQKSLLTCFLHKNGQKNNFQVVKCQMFEILDFTTTNTITIIVMIMFWIIIMITPQKYSPVCATGGGSSWQRRRE